MKFEEKVALSTGIINKVGSKVEELIDTAEQTQWKAVGARDALLKHVENLMALAKAADAELAAEGEPEKEIPDKETLDHIKRWLFKAIKATQNYADHFINVELSAIGEGAGYKNTHNILQKMVTEIFNKSESVKRGVESGDIEVDEDGEPIIRPGKPRPTGVRPGMSIKEQRLAEEAAKGGNGVDLDSMTPEELEEHLLSQ